MFERFRRLIGGRGGNRDGHSGRTNRGEGAEGIEIPRIEAVDNPWGVPVLDVRPVSLNWLSTTKDPRLATNAASYGTEDGISFIGVAPLTGEVTPSGLQYRLEGHLPDGVLFSPEVMEHKWALFFHRGQVLCVRSWTREVCMVAEVSQDGTGLTVRRIRGEIPGEHEAPGLTERAFDFLMRTHALGEQYPAPLPTRLGEDPVMAAMWCFSMFGNLAHFATVHALRAPPPREPLRTVSSLHIAVARDLRERVAALLDAGVPADVLGKDGMRPLHWAVSCKRKECLDLLLERGASVDGRTPEGMTPLMLAAQMKVVEMGAHLLDSGADVNARDNRGFTALHRVAELGDGEFVRLLLNGGAVPNAEAEGYTPSSLAMKRGHKKISGLLDGWRRSDGPR